MKENSVVLVHLASGIGNIVLATPLLVALRQMGFVIDVWLHADYAQTADLLRDWSAIRRIYCDRATRLKLQEYDYLIPAVPPFYWTRFAHFYTKRANLIGRPADGLFYQDEQEYYLWFARRLGYPATEKPFYFLPIAPADSCAVTGQTLVIAPGCKTGEMAAKRWPHFPELAARFADVALVGTADDLRRSDGASFRFPSHVRSFIDQFSLRETAELMAAAGLVVSNDSGLAHLAAACGTPTLMIFGPTPHTTLGQFPVNVRVLRQGLACEPCWFRERFRACGEGLDCLRDLTVETVEREAKAILGCNGE
jgi:ADP-heptose:LPS heptosyltransferase